MYHVSWSNIQDVKCLALHAGFQGNKPSRRKFVLTSFKKLCIFASFSGRWKKQCNCVKEGEHNDGNNAEYRRIDTGYRGLVRCQQPLLCRLNNNPEQCQEIITTAAQKSPQALRIRVLCSAWDFCAVRLNTLKLAAEKERQCAKMFAKALVYILLQ